MQSLTLTWTAVAGADSYAVTRGDLGSLGPQQYGVCEAPALALPGYDDLDPLPPDQGFTYLIRADSLLCGAGSLGPGPAGAERINNDPLACP